ncbi:bifunctional DNA primase/polymerase [soil metagenome]
MNDSQTVQRAAHRYATAGIPVLPVSGKVPLTPRGLTDATTQASKLGFWFRNYAGAGVAIACGHELRSGGHLLILDVDVRHDGDSSVEELEAVNGELPTTWTVRTPSGGWHYYYRSQEPAQTRHGFRPGLDLQGIGVYCVAPPSPGYSVETQAPLAPVPDWLLEVARDDSPGKLAPAVGSKIPKGRRDHTLASIAGTLRRRGLDADEILCCISAVNTKRCDPPLPEKDLARIACSIARRPVDRPLFGEEVVA